MPIKFRCVHCNKLLGIARRKAGTIVDCPQCKQQLIVPTPEAPEPEPEDDLPTIQPDPIKPAVPPRLFEQDQFEILLQDQDAATFRSPDGPETLHQGPFPAERHLPVPMTVAGPAAPPAPLPVPYQAAFDAPATRPAGVVLSGSKIMMLLLLMFFLLAGAFGAGIFVGKSLSAPAPTQPS